AHRRPPPGGDRFYFGSVSCRAPGGVPFEFSTVGPGLPRDAAADALGEELVLPPWLEDRREEIEARLPPL
ncbi:MAG: ring-cleaving dioxygenase, partial [Gemmatimonadota bacterium]|nr:ring-cleaving dioxygenase [Gemmatimonadota bacterium]